jgi:hypothetical protein
MFHPTAMEDICAYYCTCFFCIFDTISTCFPQTLCASSERRTRRARSPPRRCSRWCSRVTPFRRTSATWGTAAGGPDPSPRPPTRSSLAEGGSSGVVFKNCIVVSPLQSNDPFPPCSLLILFWLLDLGSKRVLIWIHNPIRRQVFFPVVNAECVFK